MANELKMEVKHAILGHARQRFSLRRIACELGVPRKTVRRLLAEQPSGDSKGAIGGVSPCGLGTMTGKQPGRQGMR